jgi:deazaflavin-dependent oxidoreductase (nitroreductase family)
MYHRRMAYRKPNWFVQKIFNPLAMMTGISGTKTLAVAGRKSGEMRKVPVITVEHEGNSYLVAPRGETQWVRNLRAAGEADLSKERIKVSEVPFEQRPPIIEAYRKVAGRAVTSHFEALPNPADHPVFRIEPA